MILKRIEQNNGVVEALYESSNIVASKYNKTNNQLSLTFKGGQEYIYENVSIADYHKLELADSQGVAFNKYLRNYPFVKGDLVDIEALRERIEEAKQDEVDNLTRNIVELAKIIVVEDADNNLCDSTLADMVRLIELRKEKMSK